MADPAIPMRVLVACEFSGRVREAFRALGHDAYSCDLLPAEDQSPFHYECDVLRVLSQPWDLVIAHPPCTHLAVSGARWFASKPPELQQQAVHFFEIFTKLRHIERVVIENPIGIMSRLYRKPDQIIQPWMFGHGEVKATCLWLKGLPRLTPTQIVAGREAAVHRCAPSPDRWKMRSRTLLGIANAMALQWGSAL